MKKRLLFIFLMSILMAGCRERRQEIEFTGELSDSPSNWIYLSEVTPEGAFILDSCFIENGQFRFVLYEKQKGLQESRQTPHFYRLSFSSDNGFTTIAKNGEIITFKADGNDLVTTYTASGSEEAQLMWQLDRQLSRFIDSTEVLQTIYENEIEDDSIRSRVEYVYLILVENHTKYLLNFISSHPNSMTTIAAFYQRYNRKIFLPEEENLALLQQIYQNLVILYPDNQNVQYLKKRIESIEFKQKTP